jgi:hypothetical protein
MVVVHAQADSQIDSSSTLSSGDRLVPMPREGRSPSRGTQIPPTGKGHEDTDWFLRSQHAIKLKLTWYGNATHTHLLLRVHVVAQMTLSILCSNTSVSSQPRLPLPKSRPILTPPISRCKSHRHISLAEHAGPCQPRKTPRPTRIATGNCRKQPELSIQSVDVKGRNRREQAPP